MAHILTFKGRDLFHPDGLQLQWESSFVLPFLYLSYSLVCVQAVDTVSTILFLLPCPSDQGMGWGIPKETRAGTLLNEKENSPPGAICHCEWSFRYNMWGSCHSCFTTKGWNSLQVQRGRAPLSVSTCNPRQNSCCRACLCSFIRPFKNIPSSCVSTYLQDTKHYQSTSNPPSCLE